MTAKHDIMYVGGRKMKSVKFIFLVAIFLVIFSGAASANPWIIQMISVTDTGERQNVPPIVTDGVQKNGVSPDNLSERTQGLVEVEWIFYGGSFYNPPNVKII